MSKKKEFGTCHICGLYSKLSFEHVPPKKAFNDRPILYETFEYLMEGKGKPIKQQKGAGGYTLCERCNNNTGLWYGKAFIEWSYQGLSFHQNSSGISLIDYPYHIYPLRVFKQIITMFFSVNSDRFGQVNPELVKLVLDKNQKYINKNINIYVYHMKNFKFGRFSPVIGLMDVLGSGKSHIMSEICFPPFGYILSFDSSPPEASMVDISFFSRYSYNDWTTLFIKIPVLELSTMMPGGYKK